jgi:hypothetical protein
MRISELRDPGKFYTNLDQQYRNQYNKRRVSAQPPTTYDYEIGSRQEIDLPTHDTETPEKIKQNSEKRSQQKRNQPTKVTPNFSGNLNNMPYEQIIRYVKDPISLEFINGFEHSLGQQFTTHYRAGNWSEGSGLKGPISGYIVTDNSAILELFISSSSRKNKKSLKDVGFDTIRMPKFTDKSKQDNVKNILSLPEYGGYKFHTSDAFPDIQIDNTDFVSAVRQLLELAKIIESMGSGFQTPSLKKEKTPTSDNTFDYYHWLANNLFNSWLNGVPSAFSRGGGESKGGYDLKDDMIVIGITEGGKYVRDELNKNPYREHAVPCDFINNIGIDICEKMFGEYKKKYQDKKSVSNSPKFMKEFRRTIFVLRQMIQRCLVLVLTSTPERKYIDFQKGWLSTMPNKDWDWRTGDVLERFRKSKIPVYHIDNGEQRLSENY